MRLPSVPSDLDKNLEAEDEDLQLDIGVLVLLASTVLFIILGGIVGTVVSGGADITQIGKASWIAVSTVGPVAITIYMYWAELKAFVSFRGLVRPCGWAEAQAMESVAALREARRVGVSDSELKVLIEALHVAHRATEAVEDERARTRARRLYERTRQAATEAQRRELELTSGQRELEAQLAEEKKEAVLREQTDVVVQAEDEIAQLLNLPPSKHVIDR